jgi:hypothetical protein
MEVVGVIDRPETGVGRRRFRWKTAIYGSYSFGIVTMLVATTLGFDLVGAIAYFLGVAVGTLACGYACFLGDVTISDERFAAIERRASHYTLMGLAYVGIAVFPGLFVLEATATGPGQQVVIGAFGGIEEMEVDGSIVIDNGHLVAWDSSLQLDLRKASSSWIGSFLSGEGKVFHINGKGRVWIQTRQPIEFGRAVAGLLPPRQ